MAQHRRNIIGTLPYSSHPLHRLRKITLWTILIGLILNFLGLNRGPGFLWGIFFYFVSAGFVVLDLVRYATEKLQREIRKAERRREYEALGEDNHSRDDDDDDDHEDLGDGDGDGEKKPKWPRRWLLVGDFMLAFLWFWIAVLTFGWAGSYPMYYYSGPEMMLYGYAVLADLVMSILHGVAWWKEVKACLEKGWKAKFIKRLRCARCGARFTSGDGDEDERRAGIGGDITNAGPSFPRWMTHGPRFSPSQPAVPRQARSQPRGSRDNNIDQSLVDVEAVAGSSDDSSTSLLIAPTPEESSTSTVKGYGTLADSCASLNVEAETLVRKKSFKRIVGMDGAEKKGKGKRATCGDENV
jgi:hypothetical protein